jgi:hypothetical protein
MICCMKLLFTRCQLQSEDRSTEGRKSVLLSVLPTLDFILKDFKQMYASAKIRDVLLFQVSLGSVIFSSIANMGFSISNRGLCLDYMKKISQTW